MKRRRVVITGLGIVAPNGIGKDAFWKNLVAGESAVDHVTAFDASKYPCKVAAEVRNFEPDVFMQKRRTKHRGRFSQFAVAAAKLAREDADLKANGTDPKRVMACLGTSVNGVGDIYETARAGFDQRGIQGVPLMTGIEFAAHAPVSHVSMELGILGQAVTIASACASGLDVIQWGHAQIAQGNADIVYAGSTEAPISEPCFAAFSALGSLTKYSHTPARASRPYDLHRDGLVLGEGAAVLLLEEFQHALSRGVRIYAEVLGFGSGNEGGFGVHVDAAELALTTAIESAIRNAGIAKEQIDHINAHGNSLPDYDLIETLAFKRAFGRGAYSIPITSIKSMVGHAMAAAASLQTAAACLTLQESMIPPTINLETPDPQCDLDYVPNSARVSRVRNVLINAHAMGGSHSVLILGAAPTL